MSLHASAAVPCDDSVLAKRDPLVFQSFLNNVLTTARYNLCADEVRLEQPPAGIKICFTL